MSFRKSRSPLGRSDESTTALLVLAQDGDSAAFGRFTESTQDDVRRFCDWLCRPGSDLDDLVQETFVRAFRGLATFRADSSARSWLLSIARRVCTDHVNRLTRERRNLAAIPVVSDAIGCSSGFVDAMAGVRDLPEAQREAFVLVAVLGFSYDEAASIMECPRGTIQSRVARARHALMSVMSESEGVSDSSATNATAASERDSARECAS